MSSISLSQSPSRLNFGNTEIENSGTGNDRKPNPAQTTKVGEPWAQGSPTDKNVPCKGTLLG
jgi:hypothetical protein